MSEPGKVRLVRCPKCENLLPELTDYSVYQCGGCGALLRAKNIDVEVDMLSEKLDEERNGGGLEKFPNTSENFELMEKQMMNLREGSGNDVRSNGSSSSRLDESKEILGDIPENFRNDSMTNTGKWVGENEEEMDENIDERGKEFGDLRPRDGNGNGPKRLGRTSDWRTGERNEMERVRSTQRVDVGGVRYSTSKYSEEVPTNYELGSNYDYAEVAERMKNRSDLDELKKVEYFEQDRAELLRKLDELKDQLSRTNVADKPNEKVPIDRRVVHQDPYAGSENWFPDGSFGQKRASMQHSIPDKHVAGPSYINHYADLPPFTNSREMAMRSFYPPIHTPNQMQGFEDPFRSQMLRRPLHQAPHPLQQQPSHPYFSGRYMHNDMANFDILEPYSHNINPHPPSCSCLHCYNQHPHVLQPVPPSVYNDKRFSGVPNNTMFYHHENPGAFGLQDYNPRFSNLPQRNSHNPQPNTRWPSDSNFEVGGFNRQRPPRVLLATGGRRCHPIAGGAPFIACHNCFELLQLPKKILRTKKSQRKLRCVACSKVILLVITDNKLVISLYEVAKKTPAKFDDISTMATKEDSSNYHGNANWGSMDFSSDDYDNSGYEFQSMDQKPVSSSTGQGLSSNQSGDMRSLHSTISCTSGDEDNPDTLISPRKEANSAELPMESNSTELPIEANPSRPPSGSPLQEHFEYSNKYNVVNRFGKGNRSGRSEQERVMPKKVSARQNSMKDAAVATELDISSNEYSNTGTSLESGDMSREEDQLRLKKGGASFFAGIIKKSFKDGYRSNQNFEQESVKVTVNGNPIQDRLVKKAEKQAGKIQPGQYWYDSRAGFWGVMDGPCLGIIPPFIEEFNYPMPEDCAGGNTGVFVNGRELHQKDLKLLGNRGLPTDRDRSYIIEMSGRVLDEDSGEELDSLGKLAPTVEKVKHGFGMKTPRAAA